MNKKGYKISLVVCTLCYVLSIVPLVGAALLKNSALFVEIYYSLLGTIGFFAALYAAIYNRRYVTKRGPGKLVAVYLWLSVIIFFFMGSISFEIMKCGITSGVPGYVCTF